MNILNEAAMEANKAWKSADKPRHGTIFHNRQSSLAKYRKRLNKKQTYRTEVYKNDLHEALLQKKTTMLASGVAKGGGYWCMSPVVMMR